MNIPGTETAEGLLFALRELYGRYGYSPYKMNKFEEYDLYAHNKDFLVSENIITFTDGTGKLLALKPDVTLSIVKNLRESGEGRKKLYYNENVYRVAKGSRNYKEIMQVGLECLGTIDGYCIYEVLKLASESLRLVRPSSVLCVSHLGILTEVMDSVGVPPECRTEVARLIGEKNLHELARTLETNGVGTAGIEKLKALVSLQGTPREVLPALEECLAGAVSKETLGGFTSVLRALAEERDLFMDFTVVGDLRYYNGFVFKGFVEGIPSSILSGGQYDRLMRKMGHAAGAIGFAVYTDLLEHLTRKSENYDADILLLYDEKTPLDALGKTVDALSADGTRVRAETVRPAALRVKRVMRYENGEVKTLEDNA